MQINQETESEVVKKPLIKTQKDWIVHYNNKGEKFFSAADAYRAAKEEKKAVMESVAKNCKDRWELTSTQINYKEDEYADIIHDAGSTIVNPKIIQNVKIPHYDGVEAKQDETTEKFLQALFNTEDRIDEILRVMKRYDPSRRLFIWTPDKSLRASRPVRSVELSFGDFGRFDVYGDDWLDGWSGFSRGVKVKSAKQTE